MKNNEEKLKQLLTLACNNGWKNTNPITYEFNEFLNPETFDRFKIDIKYCMIEDTLSLESFNASLNDLVTNFEEGEVSFIEALCNYSEMGEIYDVTGMHKQIIKGWMFDDKFNLRPTSQRLQWLFNTFNHLLV